MPFQIIRNDITKVEADAIVNTANPRPTYGGGTDAAIYKAAGEKELLTERKKIGNIARGEAVYTPAFHLNAKYIIHTVGPVWNGGKDDEFDVLRSCYEKSLELAKELKCKSIAFPLIATGVYGFPKDKALEIAMSVISSFVLKNKMKVILVVFDKKAFELSGELVDEVRAYVDANYIEKAEEEEHALDFRRGSCLDRDWNAIERRRAVADREYKRLSVNEQEPLADSKIVEKIDIKKLVATQEKSFMDKVFEYMAEKDLTAPQVYSPINISRQLFSKMQKSPDYHPNKETVILFCFSLKLDINQTNDLLARAGWTLSPSSKADLIVKGCIINKIYDLTTVDAILFDYDCPTFTKEN